jgi:outer membrane protein assembly factor BamE (lipoprotein component of BamABCDE complex)
MIRQPRAQFKLRRFMLILALLAIVFSIPSCLSVMWRTIQDTTHYAAGYSESKFNSLVPGMGEEEVIQLLGDPLRVEVVKGSTTWYYGPKSLRVAEDGGLYLNSSGPLQFTLVTADDLGMVKSATGDYLKLDGRTLVGRSLVEVKEHFGEPLTVRTRPSGRYLRYTDTQVSGSYYTRTVIIAGWYQD